MTKQEAFERMGVRTDQEMADRLTGLGYRISRQAVSAWNREQIPEKQELRIRYELPGRTETAA